MKNILFVAALLLFGACSKNKEVAISGTITEDYVGKPVVAFIPFLQIEDTICTVAEDGRFSGKVGTKQAHIGSLRIGRYRKELYYRPGSDIKIDISKTEEDKMEVAFSGSQFEGSELMYEIEKINRALDLRSLIKEDGKTFITATEESAKKVEDLILAFQETHPRETVLIEQCRLSSQINKANFCDIYTNVHKRYAPNDTLPIPEEIKECGKSIALDDNESIKENPDYKRFVVNGFMKSIKASISAKYDTKEYTNSMIDGIKETNTVQVVKDELANNLISGYVYSSDESKEVIRARYKEVLTNESHIAEFNNTLDALKKIEPGNQSPSFDCESIDGGNVKLADLKGKYVYIDVWATWCGPCRGEIPHLKTLEKDFHGKDIAFVSISIDQDKEAWKKMVKDEELGGIQLYTENAWDSDFVNSYVIKGIPRFIMLDKEGKIIDSNATRPSNPETKEKFAELLGE